ncbi:hypothetical protein AGMMS50256_27400 [Betaproteobacteria bacterium]|nr:hypothetical protein AGMMS50256_27400 [Betaproteobacteria bacterium]
MWIPSLRSVSELTFGIAISMVAVSPTQAAGYAIGECRVVNDSGRKGIRPFYDADSYLGDFLSGDLYKKNRDKVGDSFEDGEITLVTPPQHGELVLSSDKKEASWGWYDYLPGEYGEDRFVMQVEKNGVKVTIHYVVIVISDDESPRGLCNPEEWKISLLDDMNVSFSDLPGVAIAQTTGTQITLDTNAAGYGRFINYTPYLNEEWLPTSNPFERQAKPGSEAEARIVWAERSEPQHTSKRIIPMAEYPAKPQKHA